MADITKEDVIEFIANMSVLELSEMVKEMEEKFGVSAAAPVAMMAAGPMPVKPVRVKPKKRTNLTSYSLPPVIKRSLSSKRSVPSPAWV
jgi:ribosomal protein L7/L12